MNVLILTPDAVGSTLLQRVLTIYMQLHSFDRPVINLHELTNGLHKYYSPDFNTEIVGKKDLPQWGYYQTLEQIVELLSSVDHYKTSRLAHYHLVRRADSRADQTQFYQYLNDNFYIIACRRENVFEHALSMTLTGVHKKLNVYSAKEKIFSFYDLYRDGVLLDSDVFVNYLNKYRLYLEWSQQHFNVSKYFTYEKDVKDLETFVLDLPVFSGQKKLGWQQRFGISFNDWNRVHYSVSNLAALPSMPLDQLIVDCAESVADYQRHAPEKWPAVNTARDMANLPRAIKEAYVEQFVTRQGLTKFMNSQTREILNTLQPSCLAVSQVIDQMVNLGVIINGPPVKKQTLTDKKNIVKNFPQLVDVYNQWAAHNQDIAPCLGPDIIEQEISKENAFWNLTADPVLTQRALLPNQQF